jgi:hypothetical protein
MEQGKLLFRDSHRVAAYPAQREAVGKETHQEEGQGKHDYLRANLGLL